MAEKVLSGDKSADKNAPRDAVELTIGGKVHKGWTDVSISIGIDSLAHGFALTLADRWPDDAGRWVIKAGEPCSVAIAGELLISGYIDRVEVSLSGDDHSISVSGRSKAADLIDCSAIHSPGSWKQRKLEAIAADLVKPFGLSVVADASTGDAFKSFAIQPGETVFECIERMVRLRALLMISDADGTIRLVSPKPAGAATRIVLGEHVKAINARHDVTERFSTYVVKGQAAGDDEHHGKAVAQPKGEAKDAGVKRHRPLLVIAEEQASIESARKAAAWESTVRAAKSQGADVTMAGWRDPAGGLWKPMQLVDLVADAAFINGQLLVAEVTFTLDQAGSSATLRLAYPEAYQPAPPPAERADAASIKGKGR